MKFLENVACDLCASQRFVDLWDGDVVTYIFSFFCNLVEKNLLRVKIFFKCCENGIACLQKGKLCRRPTNHFCFTKYRIAIRLGVLPLLLSPLSVTVSKPRGQNARVKFVLCVTHDGLSERGTTRSLNRHKNRTAI